MSIAGRLNVGHVHDGHAQIGTQRVRNKEAEEGVDGENVSLLDRVHFLLYGARGNAGALASLVKSAGDRGHVLKAFSPGVDEIEWKERVQSERCIYIYII